MGSEINVRDLSISKNDRASMPSHSSLLTLPTILTLGRVASIPLLVATFYMDGWQGTTVTTSIFTAAAVTDWLDGYIARKVTNQLIQILSLPLPTFQSSIQHFSCIADETKIFIWCFFRSSS
jgi:hypothetical protein